MANEGIGAINTEKINPVGNQGNYTTHLAVNNPKDDLDKTDVFSFAAQHPNYC